MPKCPFWLLAGRFQSIFSHFGDVFGLFPALLFLILRRTIFRFQPNDFSFGCERFAYMRGISICLVFFWIFIHKNLFGWLLLDFLRLSYSFFLTYLRYDGIDFLLSFCYKRKL